MKVSVCSQGIDEAGVTPTCFGVLAQIMKKLFTAEITGQIYRSSWHGLNAQL